MFQYRQVLLRLRQGDSDRDIARSRLMGRPKVAVFRLLATAQGWLQPEAPLPDDAAIAAVISAPRRASSTISSVEPHRAQVERWAAQGVGGVAIHAALWREFGFRGSNSAVRRVLAEIRASAPPETTVRLTFAPGEAAQLDFGAGPFLYDAERQQTHRAWAFVMTLCFSRHQYVEFVFDQSVPTCLGLHRRAFEWFGHVPRRLIIDNPKCAITRACVRDPLVQRAYAECAEGYQFKIDQWPPADPAKKAIVKGLVKILCRYFRFCFRRSRFTSIAEINRALMICVERINDQSHRRFRVSRRERFETIEKAKLKALPSNEFDGGEWKDAKLHPDCYVAVEGDYYSAPHIHRHKTLRIKLTENQVEIFLNLERLAVHPRCRLKTGERIKIPEHFPPNSDAYYEATPQRLLSQSRFIHPELNKLFIDLFNQDVFAHIRRAMGLVYSVKKTVPKIRPPGISANATGGASNTSLGPCAGSR